MKPKAYSYLRMSTDIQLKGHSRQRQLEASKAYAEQHGLDLADDAQLEDIGISAFKGLNAKNGALGGFLSAVKSGAVEPGSYLLIESLDRISREEILPAHSLFLSIVQSGINLVTLTDDRVYQAKTTNLVDMITSLVIMERAHEESKTKSLRVGAAWRNKRVLAGKGQPMTARCPAWLRLSADRKSYEPIPERVSIVREVFSETVAGVGMYSVARRLNDRKVPAFVGQNGWHRSYIAKLLDNRAVLGEFQPHIKVDERRIPDGEVIQNYFPAIIDEELFYAAQHSTAQRKGTGKGNAGAGRKGAGFTNLFSRIASCAYCGATIAFENKGSGSKGGTYLICDGVKRKRGCTATRWRYNDFEASFLAFVKELDLESLINADAEAAQRKMVGEQVAAIRGELSVVATMMEATYKLLETGSAVEFVSGKLQELERRSRSLAEQLTEKEAQRNALTTRVAGFYQSKEDLQAFIARLQGASDAELFKLRAQIASRLRVLVDTLRLAPQGDLPKKARVIEELQKEVGAEDVAEYLKQQMADPETANRYFVVGFRNQAVRAVYPDYDDPLRYTQQIVADVSGIDRITEHSDGGEMTSSVVVVPPTIEFE